MREEQLPKAFTQRMRQLLGEEYGAFEAAYGRERTHGLRLNGLKDSWEKLEEVCRRQFHLEAIPWAAEGFYYRPEERPGKHPFHEAGLYYIQEPSAMAAVGLLDPQPGDRVLDLCAAPGGKSTQIAGRLGGRGLLVSNEIHPARAKILSQNIERLGIANSVVINQEPDSLAVWFSGFFDKILVDAPCSGEGMFRKDEDARKEWCVAEVLACSRRQKKILDAAALLLKPGGRLVYSTCTFSPEENEGTIGYFLHEHPEFFIEKKDGFSGFEKGRPAWVPAEVRRKDLEDTIRIWPHRVEGEGHYLAVLRKAETADGSRKSRAKASRQVRREVIGLEQFCQETLCMETGILGPWEKFPGRYFMFGEKLYYIPEDLPDLKGMKVLRPGLHLGNCRKNRFEPAHALALYLKPNQVKRTLSLAVWGEDVVKYLKGETLEAAAEGQKGWRLITTEGYSLGWGKQSGDIIKNHYPKGLRCTLERQ